MTIQDANIQDALIATDIVIMNNSVVNLDDIEIPIVNDSITNANVRPIVNAEVVYIPSHILSRMGICDSYDFIFLSFFCVLFTAFIFFHFLSIIYRIN
jgi:hypothetical protein